MEADQVSMTARRVSYRRLTLNRVAAPFGRPEADDRLQAAVAGDLELDPSPMAAYFQARTTWFDQVVVSAIDGGLTQLVAVGAGYDGRSLRYAKPGVRWFELDHPATQADKRARLAGLDLADLAPLVDDIGFASADFAIDDVGVALAGVGHDRHRASLFTCEGVAAYLGDEVLASLVTALRGAAAPASRLAIEVALEPRTDEERARRSRLGAAVGGMGEPLRAGLAREDLHRFLAAAGWVVDDARDPAGVPIGVSPRSTAFVLASPSAG